MQVSDAPLSVAEAPATANDVDKVIEGDARLNDAADKVVEPSKQSSSRHVKKGDNADASSPPQQMHPPSPLVVEVKDDDGAALARVKWTTAARDVSKVVRQRRERNVSVYVGDATHGHGDGSLPKEQQLRVLVDRVSYKVWGLCVERGVYLQLFSHATGKTASRRRATGVCVCVCVCVSVRAIAGY